jgi:hypothetical protein
MPINFPQTFTQWADVVLKPIGLLTTILWIIYLTLEIRGLRKRRADMTSAEPSLADMAVLAKLDEQKKELNDRISAQRISMESKLEEQKAWTLKELNQIYESQRSLATKHSEQFQAEMTRVSISITTLAKELGNVTGMVDVLRERGKK